MKQRITLTINEDLIKSAKKNAKKQGVSLSSLVENYFLFLTKDVVKKEEIEISSRVRKL
ncbi:MAG: hypothetical protein ACI9XO_002945 [Paraglaciecola sp.]|jgi:predicted HicB family RNase H-like nuclease